VNPCERLARLINAEHKTSAFEWKAEAAAEEGLKLNHETAVACSFLFPSCECMSVRACLKMHECTHVLRMSVRVYSKMHECTRVLRMSVSVCLKMHECTRVLRMRVSVCLKMQECTRVLRMSVRVCLKMQRRLAAQVGSGARCALMTLQRPAPHRLGPQDAGGLQG
jgi:hypothetical protein